MVNKKKKLPYSFLSLRMALTIGLLGLSSCIGLDNQGQTTIEQGGSAQTISNTPASVSVGYGRILTDNPIILSGDTSLSYDVDLNKLLSSGQTEIVYGQQLVGSCKTSDYATISNCFQAMEDEFSSPLVSASGKWAYDANSSEFAQVQGFGHVKLITDKYLEDFQSMVPNVLTSYPSAIPDDSITGKYFWPQDSNLSNRTLNIYALCDIIDNAYFDPTNFNLCFGYDRYYKDVKFVHDNTVVYHEMGHALNYMMVNLRNNQVGTTEKANIGGFNFYDEMGNISEGVADYYSYYMNQRKHVGEWALGRFINGSRPMSEDDPLHIDGLDTSSEGRLSYPSYINYRIGDTEQPYEDIHYAGKIFSHYMVAFTEHLSSKCELSIDQSQEVAMRLLTETFAQMGDLTAKGHEKNIYGKNFVNLNPTHAFEWYRINNPVTARSFAQTWAKFAKYLLVDSSSNNLCSNGAYTTDDIEGLLDDYGLLLFTTYNEDGNGYKNDLSTPPGNEGPRTLISLSSRQKSKLIPKEYLTFDERSGASKAFIFDGREDMLGVLQTLNVDGVLQQSISEQIPSDLKYNNGNGLISPGEFLGVLPNIYNDHTEPMAGIQILGNDWDHFKDDRPCNNMGDNFPTLTEGGADLSIGEGVEGACDYVTRSNGDEEAEDLAPVCFLQLNEDNATRWASQEELIDQINLDPTKCLGGEDNKKDCFLRAVKGAESSNFSKMNAKESWVNTLKDKDGSPQYNISNLIFFEVSPWIPPGTKFNCRLRARFVNCEDCFYDKDTEDDFLDYEYSGGKPFKILNFSFRVVD